MREERGLRREVKGVNMRVLAMDIGAGTQDILLYDSSKQLENCVKLVLPSPSPLLAGRVITLEGTGKDLFIGGRSDDTIIRGGENIAPAELEEVLIEHSHVRDVAVVGVDDPQWGQAIVAVVVPAVGIDPDPEELREHVRKSLRGSRTPDRVVFADELPTTPTGKVLRREIVDNLRTLGTPK